MDRIVFGPPRLRPRYLIDLVNSKRTCVECKGAITYGQRYAFVGDACVCEPCADDIEAGRRA
jgi:hypothetical protein